MRLAVLIKSLFLLKSVPQFEVLLSSKNRSKVPPKYFQRPLGTLFEWVDTFTQRHIANYLALCLNIEVFLAYST